MLRRTFLLVAALFVISACGPNCNVPYGVVPPAGCYYGNNGYGQNGQPPYYPGNQYPPQYGYQPYPQPQPYPYYPVGYCPPGNPYCFH